MTEPTEAIIFVFVGTIFATVATVVWFVRNKRRITKFFNAKFPDSTIHYVKYYYTDIDSQLSNKGNAVYKVVLTTSAGEEKKFFADTGFFGGKINIKEIENK